MDPYSAQVLMMNQIGQLSGELVEHIRSILIALGIMILGLVVSEIIRFFSVVILKVVRWDRLCSLIGFTRLLAKVRPDINPSVATGHGLFWFSMLWFFMVAFLKSGLDWLVWLGRAYFDFLPDFFQAAVILLAAWVVAQILAWLILLFEHPAAALSAGMTRILVLILGAYGSLLVLGFDRGLVQPLVLILFAGLLLAWILAWMIPNRVVEMRPIIRVSEIEEESR